MPLPSRFTANVSGMVRVLDPQGKRVWHRQILSAAGSFTLEEVRANSRIYRTALEQAVAQFAGNAVREL